MKIVSIFDDRLFAFDYSPNEDYNEYDRLMDFWTDMLEIKKYAEKNKVSDVPKFIERIIDDAEEIQDFLDDITDNDNPLELYFEILSLNNFKILPLQKGKIANNGLRLYALKIEDNCFVITGGAIKMSQKMEDHPDTANELKKLYAAREYLNQNGVFDKDSFYEFLND